MSDQWPRSVAVVGAGYMGRGIAEVFAIAGQRTLISDVTAERADSALATLIAETERHAADGLVAPDAPDLVRALVGAAPSTEAAAADADLVVEAVFEDRDTKVATLERIESAARPATVIATNTSAISIGSLASALRRPERFLGAHWFNPPQFVPGVELIGCEATTQDVLDRVEEFLHVAGKEPCRVADSPGFVGNRLQYALFQEAAAIVEEGLASPEIVDRVVRSTFGFRLPFYGPFAIADMAGLDVYRGAYRVLHEAFPERFVPPRLLSDSVERGDLGGKTGRGLVIKDATEAAEMAARRDRLYRALAGVLRGEPHDPTAADPLDPERR